MEKSLTLRGCGQLWPQKYGPMLLKMMEEGKISTPWMLTHTMPLSDVSCVAETGARVSR
jgi:threonine dehydrogenase-like Zn-dependent dehydrogenase